MTNEELVEDYLSGNIDAFEILWKNNLVLAKTIVNKYRYIVGYDFEDLLSECEAEFWRWIPKYDRHKGSFAWYIGRVMESKMKQLLEKSKTKSRDGVVVYFQQPIGGSNGSEFTLADILESSEMSSWIEGYENHELLFETMNIFSKTATTVEMGIVEAKVISGYSISAIARHLGWRREKVRNALSSSLERIREICNSLLECGASDFSKRRGEVCYIYEVS